MFSCDSVQDENCWGQDVLPRSNPVHPGWQHISLKCHSFSQNKSDYEIRLPHENAQKYKKTFLSSLSPSFVIYWRFGPHWNPQNSIRWKPFLRAITDGSGSPTGRNIVWTWKALTWSKERFSCGFAQTIGKFLQTSPVIDNKFAESCWLFGEQLQIMHCVENERHHTSITPHLLTSFTFKIPKSKGYLSRLLLWYVSMFDTGRLLPAYIRPVVTVAVAAACPARLPPDYLLRRLCGARG